MELNNKLAFVNRHNLCQIEGYKTDIVKLKQENIDLKVSTELKPQDFDQRILEKCLEIDSLKQQLKKRGEDVYKSLKQQEELKEQKQSLLESLDSSHQLVDKQVKCNQQNLADIQRLETELKHLNEKYNKLTDSYNAKSAEYEKAYLVHEMAVSEWKIKEESLTSQLLSLEQDFEALVNAHSELEELNSSWAQQNSKLVEDVKALKVKFEKETAEQGAQTEDDVQSVCTQTEEDIVGHIVELEKTVADRDVNMQSLKDKVEFFEEIAKGAGHMTRAIEELKEGMKVKEAEIIELSKPRSIKDQVTQIDVKTSDEFAQTSQEFPASHVAPSSDASTNTHEQDALRVVPSIVSLDSKVISDDSVTPPSLMTSNTESFNLSAEQSSTNISVPDNDGQKFSTTSSTVSQHRYVDADKDSANVTATSLETKSPNGKAIAAETSTVESKTLAFERNVKSQNQGSRSREDKAMSAGTEADDSTISEPKSQKLCTESRVKYLASMMQYNLGDEDDTFHSQELNEALHSRLRKKVALLRGEGEKHATLSSLSKLSKGATKRSPESHTSTELGGLSDRPIKPGKSPSSWVLTNPITLGTKSASASSPASTSSVKSRLGMKKLPLDLTTTLTKSLAKPAPVYAHSKRALLSSPILSSVTSSPSVVVGSKNNSAFSNVSRNPPSSVTVQVKESGIGNTSGVGIMSGLNSSNRHGLSTRCSTSSESIANGKRKCLELGAGDAFETRMPLGREDDQSDGEPRPGTSGILLDPLLSRQKLAKRVRFESQTTEQSYEEHLHSFQTVCKDDSMDCVGDTTAIAEEVASGDGEHLLFSDEEQEEMVI